MKRLSLLWFVLFVCQSTLAGDGLLGTYYDQNGVPYAWFSGTSLQQIDPVISFNWGMGAPVSGIPADDFSIRWTGSVDITTVGKRKFRTHSDDGVRLYIDLNRDGDFNDVVGGINERLIDNWTDHSASYDSTGFIDFSVTGQYPIQLEFYERSGDAVIELSWQIPGYGGYSIIPQANLYSNNSPKLTGVSSQCTSAATRLTVNFDQDMDLTTLATVTNYSINNGVSVTNVTVLDNRSVELQTSTMFSAVTYTLTVSNVLNAQGDVINASNNTASFTVNAGTLMPGIVGTYYDQGSIARAYFTGTAIERVDNTINFNWGSGIPIAGVGANDFSIRWEGIVVVPVTNNYQFHITSDDGVRVYLDGSLIIDDWNDHGPRERSSALMNLLSGSEHNLIVEFYERGGGAVAQLRWSSSAISKQIVPAGNLFYCAAVVAPDHFSIVHSGLGVTCEAEPVTIIAMNADNTVKTDYVGNINLSVSTVHGDWQLLNGFGSFSNGGNGASSYSYTLSDNGSVQLALANPNAETININVIDDNAITENSGTATIADDQTLTYADTGFRFYGDGVANQVGTQISGKDSSLAPGNQTLTLRAVQTGTDTGACEARLPAGNHAIEFAFECRDPVTCIAGQVFTVNGSGISSNGFGAVSSYNNISLSFDATATSAITLNYSDAGEVTLHARKTLAVDGNGPAITLQGSSNPFVVKPAGLCVEATDMLGSCSAPYSDVACPLFRKTDQDFNVRVSARAWQAAGEVNSDFCSGNAITPNFQHNAIALSSSVVAPVGGSNGVLASNSTTIVGNGYRDVNESINEVGAFTLNASLTGGYLGETLSSASSNTIGRFAPDHFVLSGLSLTPACGSFSYLGQALDANYTVSAMNNSGSITQNYHDEFVRLDDTLGSLVFSAIDIPTLTSLNGRLSASSMFNWVNGQLASTSSITMDRISTPDGPYTAVSIGLLPTDSDGISVLTAALDLDSDNNSALDAVMVGQTPFRYGRLLLRDAHGPEIYNLPVDFHTQYWTGNNFVKNVADSCTQIARVAIVYPDGNIQLPANLTTSVAAGSTSGMYGAMDASNIQFNLGDAQHYFSAPGFGNTGSFTVNVGMSSLPWLQYDWNGDGVDDGNLPQATYTFGSYRGNDRIIHWREVQN